MSTNHNEYIQSAKKELSDFQNLLRKEKINHSDKKSFFKWYLENNDVVRKYHDIARYNDHPFKDSEFSETVHTEIFNSYYDTVNLFSELLLGYKVLKDRV